MMRALFFALVLGVALPVSAQRPDQRPVPEAVAAKRAQRRALLEQRYRARGEEVVRRQLELTDRQMVQLREVNRRFDGRRTVLFQRMRDNRLAMRAELARGRSADQQHVTQLTNQWRGIERDRLALQQDEQGQLATFLTPVQAAKYAGLQAQLRKRVRAMTEDTGTVAP